MPFKSKHYVIATAITRHPVGIYLCTDPIADPDYRSLPISTLFRSVMPAVVLICTLRNWIGNGFGTVFLLYLCDIFTDFFNVGLIGKLCMLVDTICNICDR
jgi:hypothetical protein